MAQFVVSSYQLQKWALSIREGQEEEPTELAQHGMAKSLDEIEAVLRTQNEKLLFPSKLSTVRKTNPE